MDAEEFTWDYDHIPWKSTVFFGVIILQISGRSMPSTIDDLLDFVFCILVEDAFSLHLVFIMQFLGD